MSRAARRSARAGPLPKPTGCVMPNSMSVLAVEGNRIRPVRRIAVVAPSSRPEPDAIEIARARLEAAGFAVSVDPRCFLDAGWTAGSDADRLAALNDALQDETIDCVLCGRGGFGSPKIADEVAAPRGRKVVVGYSDATYLLTRLSSFAAVTPVHAAMGMEFANPAKAEACDALLRLLSGEDLSGLVTDRFAGNLTALRPGAFDAPLAGGNLVTLQMTLGTENARRFRGAALMLEDAGERMYELDRAFDHLRRGGLLDGIAALVLGDMPPKPDDGGFGVEHLHAVVTALAERIGVPALAGFPIGHGALNLPVVWGARLRFDPTVA